MKSFFTWIGITFLFGACASQAASEPRSAADVVERSVEAVGGRDALQDVRSIHVSGTYAMPSYNLEGTIELYFARPDQLLFVVEFPGFGTVQRGITNDIGW